MTARIDEHEQRRALDVGYRRAELTLEQLWVRYFALGGVAGLVEVEAYLHGVMSLPALQRDILAQAVNERLDELTWRHRVLKDRSFRPSPVRERMIPKAGGKRRRLGIAAVRDRVVQASLKLVLEPIFEADFLPCSYGFRPNRRTHDAVAEVRHLTSHSYEWIVEGDITACLDASSHCSSR
jgi:Reverse transcriptase (RNA-dependent DNA polymerase)